MRLISRLNLFQSLLILIAIFFIGVSWRAIHLDPDGMHEGFHLLLAVSATKGIFPPEVFTRYGIIQPSIEGFWLLFQENNLVSLRVLTFIFILSGFLGILLIGRKLIIGYLSWLPATIWLWMNPINDFFQPLTQSTWPNLVGHNFVIWMFFFLIKQERNELGKISSFFLFGTFVGALPLVRLQFLTYSLLFLLIVFLSFGTKKLLVTVISSALIPVALNFIFELKGESLRNYLAQVTFVGITERERLGNIEAISQNFFEFFVATIMPSLIICMILGILIVTSTNQIKLKHKSLVLSFLSFGLFLAFNLSSNVWWTNVMTKLQIWFCGGALVVIFTILSQQVISQRKNNRKRLALKHYLFNLSLQTRYSLYFISAYFAVLSPPLMFNNGTMRYVGPFLVLAVILLFRLCQQKLLRRVFLSLMSFLMTVSLALSLVGAIKYISIDRVPIENSFSYKGMYATPEKMAEHQMEIGVINYLRSDLKKQNISGKEIIFTCSNGIYHVDDDIIYGDTSNWYQLDMVENELSYVLRKFRSLSKNSHIVGCLYSKNQIDNLVKSGLLEIKVLEYSEYSKTYSFLAYTL